MSNTTPYTTADIEAMPNANMPAHPSTAPTEGGQVYFPGLTKREWFAGLAMQGYLASNDTPGDWEPSMVASRAVKYADALLAALASTEDSGGTA